MSVVSSAAEFAGFARARQVFEWMKQDGCEPNTITYSALISACEKGFQWQLALQVFEDMKRAGVVPNRYTFNALISACGKCGQVDEAFRTFEEMKAMSRASRGDAPCCITYRCARALSRSRSLLMRPMPSLPRASTHTHTHML